MKKWQDRGEVQDSDDEELSLEAEEQSPERARKRARLDNASKTDRKSPKVQQNDAADDEAWFLPQLTTTYGRKARARNQATFNTAEPVLDQQSVDSVGSQHGHSDTIKPDDVLDGEKLVVEAKSSQSTESEDLPDVRRILANHGEDHQSQHGKQDVSTKTVASSPLSELQVSSHSTPVRFRFSGLGQTQDTIEHLPHDHSDSNDSLSDEDELEEAPAVAMGRRNLRARNEKQLHPYMFDKAQYQRQCRERGIRPIRYVEPAVTAAETQEASMSGDDSGNQVFDNNSSFSLARPSSILGEDEATSRERRTITLDVDRQGRASESDDELPDLQSIFQRTLQGRSKRGFKRRKLSHIAIPSKSAALSRMTNFEGEQEDQFSVHPSPSPTSSDSIAARRVERGANGFRMPRGLTPVPLPTPQISSDIRGEHGRTENELFDTESSPKRSRPSTISRPRRRSISIGSSAESSGAEPEPGADDRRLQRERKRIKGVLPASWLKIDLRAQQKQLSPSPSRRRRLSSPSPPRTIPQKGVAQKVMARRPCSPKQSEIVSISDDDPEPFTQRSPLSTRGVQESNRQFDREDQTIAPSEFVDIDEMEANWIDPMLTSSSRPRSRLPNRKQQKQQPRITDAFRRARGDENHYMDEREALWTASRSGTVRTKDRKKNTNKQTQKYPAAHRLSIIDVLDPELPERTLPPFVRLAIRNVRTRKDHGRHSPNHKHIRLARSEDTKDATTALIAWREGTIAPLRTPPMSRSKHPTSLDEIEFNDIYDNPIPNLRTPLAELSDNAQRKLPAPLRSVHKTRLPKQIATSIRRPRMQQIRLHSAVIRGELPASQPQTPEIGRFAPTVHGRLNRTLRPMQPRVVRPRGAQVESLETDFDHDNRTAAFERRMRELTESVTLVPKTSRATTGYQLTRFLNGPDTIETPPNPQMLSSGRATHHYQQGPEISAPSIVLPHRIRKRRARQIDADTREYRQPSEPIPDVIDLISLEEQAATFIGPVLHGLGPYGTKYATDFDVLPLAIGTYFHESTFIGSGDFAASLNFAGRNLDTPSTGRINIHVDEEIFECGAWTEEIAVCLSRISTAVSIALRSLDNDNMHLRSDALNLLLRNVDYWLLSVVRYFTRCVAFFDPVDRISCVKRLHVFVEDILEATSSQGVNLPASKNIVMRCFQYALVLSKQALNLTEHSMVQSELKSRCRIVMIRAATQWAHHLFPNLLRDLRSFYEDNRHIKRRESGIQDNDISICGIVVLHHVLDDPLIPQSLFWSTIYKVFNVDTSALRTTQELDRSWYDLFTLLPIMEIDATGIARVGCRLNGMREDWCLVKNLTCRLLELYSPTSAVHSSTVNDYVRATLRRCYQLVNTWGWWRCEPILGTMFDFFARQGLASLYKEETRGSPKFLEELDGQPSFEVQPEDRSFHIFLKTLASSLLSMSKHALYADKKIGGIAWRFIPNHGRTYRKDAEVRQNDIDALRNHHDLLCTLYYASPPAHRLRVELIQNLVDHSTSHREACRLNVRAWANLASFQMSTAEGTERIDPFITWYRDMILTTVDQYRLARTEVEQEAALARVQGGALVPPELMEDVIARNQRQIAATLVDALAALKGALHSSRDWSTASHLLNASKFWQVLDLYEPSTRRLNGVLGESLDLFEKALEVQAKFESTAESQLGSDDSQDYGDPSAIQDLVSNNAVAAHTDRRIADILHAPVGQLVSNLFGADAMTDNTLLTKLVDVWTHLAKVMVSTGKRSWTSYISDYTSDAWCQLRDTEQQRKFTPYFLAQVVERADIDIAERTILNGWMRCLVEREAMLKFQHVLLNALLNRQSNEPLLQNLPFSHQARGRFNVSLQEFRQQRLSLVSSLLSNVRQHFDKVMRQNPHSLLPLRKMYADILKQLMQAMKTNYQQLETYHNEQTADVQAKGVYVEFVQQVISFMQQYTTDICQVDRFFTDSAAFPLPAMDPMYVVGRLRAYVPKLAEEGKRKELVTFVQSVSERAVIDGQQMYLIDQLVAAMGGVLERGDPKAPSLRHVLMTAVFPAYIENALSTAHSWIIAKLIILSCGRAVKELLYDTKLDDDRSVQVVQDTVLTLLHSMAQVLMQAVAHPGLMVLPHIQTTLATVFETARECLTPARHLEQATEMGYTLAGACEGLIQYAAAITEMLSGSDETVRIERHVVGPEMQCPWPDTLDFSRKQFRVKLNADWDAHDGQYYVKKGNSSVKVAVDLKDEVEERFHLSEALKEYLESYQTIFVHRQRDLHRVRDSCGIGGLMV